MSLEESGVLVECAGELREEIGDVVAEGAGLLHGAQRVGVMRDAAERGGGLRRGGATLPPRTRAMGPRRNPKKRSAGKPPFRGKRDRARGEWRRGDACDCA